MAMRSRTDLSPVMSSPGRPRAERGGRPLPAMMMALAAMRDLPCVLVPGGVTLPPVNGEDAGKIQTIGARFAHGAISLAEAAELGCRACATPGGGCQFLGTAATAQVVAEALGVPHARDEKRNDDVFQGCPSPTRSPRRPPQE